jgi:hypothetical protein
MVIFRCADEETLGRAMLNDRYPRPGRAGRRNPASAGTPIDHRQAAPIVALPGIPLPRVA